MLPVSLTIEGLYSYKKRTTIDFQSLSQDHLFGIFGAVGSGKSTLLEAILFAIYGQVERMNRNDKVSENMLNLSSDKLYVEYSFSAKNEIWTAVRQLKRSGRQKQNIEVVTPAFYKGQGNAMIPVEEQEFLQAVGLSYENFRRVVIIPQGKFQEFLQLGDSKRSEMMMELFPELQKFDLSEKAAVLLTETGHKIKVKEETLLALGEISEENIEQLSVSVKEKEQQLLQGKEVEIILSRQLQEMQQIKDLSEKLEKTRKDLQNVEQQTSEILALEAKVNKYEHCVNVFKTDLVSFETAETDFQKLHSLLKKQEDDSCVIKQKISDSDKRLHQLKEQYEHRQELQDKAQDLGHICSIFEEETKLSEARNESKIKGNEIAENALKINSLKENIQKLSEENSALKNQLLNEDEITVLSNWFSVQKLLVKDKFEKLQTLSVCEITCKNALQKITDALQKVDFLHHLPVDFPEIEKILNSKLQTVAKEKQQTEEHLQHLQLKEKLSEYSKELKDNHACPLCGSLEHPKIIQYESVAKEISALQANKEQNRIEEQKIRDLHTGFLKLDNERQKSAENLFSIQKQIEKSQADLEVHLSKFPQQTQFSPDNETTFVNALEKNRIQKQEITKKEKERALYEQNLTELLAKTETLKAEHQKITEGILFAEGSVRTILGQLKLLTIEECRQYSLDTLKRNAEHLRNQHKEIEQAYADENNQRQQWEQNLSHLDGGILQLKQQMADKTAFLQTKEKEIATKLQQTSYSDLREIKEILLQNLDIQEIHKQINKHKETLHALKELFLHLENQLSGAQFDAEKYEQLQAQHKSKKEEQSILNQELGKLTHKLSTLKTDLERQKLLKKELQQLQIRHEHLQKFKSLFSGNKFVKFVSSLYLQEMCNAANKRFMNMNRNRLSLELNENANFVIRDFMNEGKTRNVKTLSGGQTFQAALALALAMTDNLHLDGDSKSFFFLDEGFGSLDSKSLQTVFESLRLLRYENRIVGLISHVEDMKREIPRYLQITNTEENGSEVEMVFS